jgi:hypothetical protein
MMNVTVIFTQHKESGKCNSSELLNIIEIIKPTVIFEELSHSNFDKSYRENKLVTLETNTIKNYIINKEIIQLPVDTFPRTREYDESVDLLYSRICGCATQDSFYFRQTIEQQTQLANSEGFTFLNSQRNDQLLNELDKLKTKILEFLNEENLYKIQRDELQMIKDREDKILKNIYAFASNNQFEYAVLFIGSGHRRTILPLIENFNTKEQTKISWQIYV